MFKPSFYCFHMRFYYWFCSSTTEIADRDWAVSVDSKRYLGTLHAQTGIDQHIFVCGNSFLPEPNRR